MNESFTAIVPLEVLLAAVKKYEYNGGIGPQPNLVVNVDDHSVLTIGPEPVEITSIPSIQRD